MTLPSARNWAIFFAAFAFSEIISRILLQFYTDKAHFVGRGAAFCSLRRSCPPGTASGVCFEPRAQLHGIPRREIWDYLTNVWPALSTLTKASYRRRYTTATVFSNHPRTPTSLCLPTRVPTVSTQPRDVVVHKTRPPTVPTFLHAWRECPLPAFGPYRFFGFTRRSPNNRRGRNR